MTNAYRVENPDFNLSPYTGMTRQHYIDCAKYLLERAFTHIDAREDVLRFPWVPGKTYPQPSDPPWRTRSLEFEALDRTATLAIPLMHIEPDVAIKGIKLKDYYSYHLYRALTPGNPNSLPLPEELPDATYQFTCEFGGLFKTLFLFPDVLWADYTQKQRDEMAVTISAWAHHRTTQNNWRIFNIVALSFLKKHGYEIDDDLLKSHLMWIISYHSGGGWFLEQTYNYYTISLFVVYTIIWCRFFGDEFYPKIASAIEDFAVEQMKTYPNFFGRDGYINMWARSICYRTWISGGFPVSFLLKDGSPLDPGWSRRLCSGSLLQFVGREDFFENDIPSVGFYGHREFVLQDYSCAASPFLMFLPFICLALPEDSPFWTARENEGDWEKLGDASSLNVLDKAGLMIVNHGISGASEIIPGKVYYDDPNYNKLVYSTHFPWENHNPSGGTAMEYCFRSLDPRDLRGDDINFYLTGIKVQNSAEMNSLYTTSQSILFNGVRDDVIYRQLIMRKPPNNGVGYIIDLAEIVIPGGVVRVDRSRMAFEHELTLGTYGLPHMGGARAVVESFEDFSGESNRVITASIPADAYGPARRVALITYSGWDEVRSQVHEGFNAEAAESTVLYAYRKRTQKNAPMELMISVMLHRRDDGDWTKEELSPIKDIKITDVTPHHSILSAEITLADGRVATVDFKDIDGYKSC